VVGIGLCGIALYAVVSLALEETRHREVLPTFRRGSGSRVLEPELGRQIEHLAAEAGVREEL
jgi:hypothetical protein